MGTRRRESCRCRWPTPAKRLPTSFPTLAPTAVSVENRSAPSSASATSPWAGGARRRSSPTSRGGCSRPASGPPFSAAATAAASARTASSSSATASHLLADLDRAGDEPLMLARAVPRRRRARLRRARDRGRARRARASAPRSTCSTTAFSIARFVATSTSSSSRPRISADRRVPFGRLREPGRALARARRGHRGRSGRGRRRRRAPRRCPSSRCARTLGAPVPLEPERPWPPDRRRRRGARRHRAARALRPRPRRAGLDGRAPRRFPRPSPLSIGTTCDRMAAAVADTGACGVLTTEKDAVRLLPLRPLPFAVAAMPLEVAVRTRTSSSRPGWTRGSARPARDALARVRHRLEYALVRVTARGRAPRARRRRLARSAGRIGLAFYASTARIGAWRSAQLPRGVSRRGRMPSAAPSRARRSRTSAGCSSSCCASARLSPDRDARAGRVSKATSASARRSRPARAPSSFPGHFGYLGAAGLAHALVLPPMSVLARPLDNPYLHDLLERDAGRDRQPRDLPAGRAAARAARAATRTNAWRF